VFNTLLSFEGIVIYNSLLYWKCPCKIFQWKVPLVIYISLLCWIDPETKFPCVGQASIQNSATATFLQGAKFNQQEKKEIQR
jgi:hypothetical protein